ncbi:MAG: hypothetical protein ACYC7E_06665 [Armatimonadota bacterium]
MEGHEFDHVIEFARGAKASQSERNVIVLTGPQDENLSNALRQEVTISQVISCFPKRWIGDGSSPRELLQAAMSDARILRKMLADNSQARSVSLFFCSFALYQLLMLAFLKLLMPGWHFESSGIFRFDPMNKQGRLRGKYRVLQRRWPATMLWKRALNQTRLFTDSSLLQHVLREELSIAASIVSIPIPGVWHLPEHEVTMTLPTPCTVGYIGQPRSSRSFDLFVLSALAMERERNAGLVNFLAVLPPGSDVLWDATKYSSILRTGLPGIALEERTMTGDEFAVQINRMDIVWGLGDPAIYRRQTSGIIAHAVCLGKRIITNQDSWAQASLHSTALARFVEPDLMQITEAIRSFSTLPITDLDIQEIQRWRRQHSQEAFYRFVAETIGCVEEG